MTTQRNIFSNRLTHPKVTENFAETNASWSTFDTEFLNSIQVLSKTSPSYLIYVIVCKSNDFFTYCM